MSDESTPAAANEDAPEAQAPDEAPSTPVADGAATENGAPTDGGAASDAAAPEPIEAHEAPEAETPAAAEGQETVAEAAAVEVPAGDGAPEQAAAEPPAAEAPSPATSAPEPPKQARPPVTGSSAGTGRRKEAVARVRLVPGSGRFDLGGRSLEQAFPNRAHRMEITAPLRLVDHEQDLDVLARLTGGGVAGQAGALRHGIARALVELDPGLRPALKAEGFLTRDPREKERRKYGLKKARKAPQYSKR